MHWRSTRGVIPVLGFALIALAAAAPVAAQDEQERARQVYQIFKDNCLECHGADAEGRARPAHARHPAEGRRRAATSSCRTSPTRAVSTSSSRTKTIRRCRRKKPKLADADIELIRQWIEDGASLEGVEEAVADNATSADAKLKAEERPITAEERR